MSHHNLGRQFERAAEQAENQQRERFSRPRAYGFIGNGYNYGGYPYMLGAMGGYGFGYGYGGYGGYGSGTNAPNNSETSSGASDNTGMGGTSAGSYGDVGGAGGDSGGGGY